jgi:ABC-type enterochelin transport system permease subunit
MGNNIWILNKDFAATYENLGQFYTYFDTSFSFILRHFFNYLNTSFRFHVIFYIAAVAISISKEGVKFSVTGAIGNANIILRPSISVVKVIGIAVPVTYQ